MRLYGIERRKRVLVNTDPQRRCYNGCHYSSEYQWGPWESFDSDIPEDRIKRSLRFWRELNDYAVSDRGQCARVEYRAVKHTQEE